MPELEKDQQIDLISSASKPSEKGDQKAPNGHSSTRGEISSGTTVDPDEVAFFAEIADTWWSATGPFKPLHELNPTRLAFIRDSLVSHFKLNTDSLKPLSGLKLLDIGCGGGLLCEPLTRMGAQVTGVDASEKNIKVAALHAEQSGLTIDYRNTTSEALAEAGEQFDAIINMEVIEHVADVDAFLSSCRALVKPEGLMLVSTLNRTAKSLLMAKIGAEYILRWLPVGAHDWRKFITPAEMDSHLEQAGFKLTKVSGFAFHPIKWKWRIDSRDVDVNYAVVALPKS